MGETKILCTRAVFVAAVLSVLMSIMTLAMIASGAGSASAQTTDCSKDTTTIDALRTKIAPARFTTLTCVGGYATSIGIVEQGLRELPPDIGRLTKLTELDVEANELTKLPPEIGNLKALQRLYGGYNSLSGLPSEIGNLAELRQFSLKANKLTTLPTEFGRLTKLEWLDLSINELTEAPPAITNFPALTFLSLSNNRRLGALPRSIGNLSALETLEARVTDLDFVPAEIGKLTNLTTLDLTANNITTLPAEIGNLTKLTQLELYANDLITLPAELTNVASLDRLNIDSNPLADQLPFVAVSSCDTGSPQLMAIVASFVDNPVAPKLSVNSVALNSGSLTLLNTSPLDSARVWKATLPRAGTGPKYDVVVDGKSFTVGCAGYQDELTIASSCLARNGRVDFMLVNDDTTSRYRIAFPGLSARARTVKQTEAWRMPFTGRPDGTYEVVITKTRLADNKTTKMARTVVVDCDSGNFSGLSSEIQVVSYCVAGNGFIRYQFVNPVDTDRGYVVKVAGLPNRSVLAKGHNAAISGVSGRPDGAYLTTVEYADRRDQPVFSQSVTVNCD